MTNNTKRLMKVDVTLADGTGTTWTRADDKLDKAALTETNVLMILGSEGEVLMMYGPMMWLTAASTYDDVAGEQPARVQGRRK